MATDKQWRDVKALADDIATYSCILELRDRIEALEAAQQAHADASHVIDPEREKAALEMMQAAGFAPRWPEVELRAVTQPAKPSHPEIPDGSLLSRVDAVIDNGTACDREPERIARDVIRAVAAWMRKQRPWGVAFWVQLLEQEAER